VAGFGRAVPLERSGAFALTRLSCGSPPHRPGAARAEAVRPANRGVHREVPFCPRPHPSCGKPECVMSKGMDRKKETKKKPAKTPQEKRAEKNEKKANKPFAPT
jgi:hypothetical protein